MRTPTRPLAVLLLLGTLAAAPGARADGPIRLHPDNPRYLEFRGRPTVLLTSGEHYGAVLNRDFRFGPYLDELARHGLNLTRTFAGTYREVPGSFNIRENTLAPKPGRYQSPWVLKDQDGERYDLDAFDPAYFERLKRFLTEADRRGIVVELVLFCPFYEPVLWDVNPMNARHNVNGVGDCPREEVYTLKHPELLKRQLAFVTRVVTELNGFDNLYYEICNEPYFVGVTPEWQRKVSETIVAAERGLPKRHLIAQNIANDQAKVTDPDPNVAIFNFHYATPPVTVALNAGLNKPIADDETGFKGTADRHYRTEAWEFLLAGGAVVSHLDYSFTTERPDGTAPVQDPTPGGGGPALRSQFAFLKRFVDGLDLARIQPSTAIRVARGGADGARAWCLAVPGRQYAAYIRGGQDLVLSVDLPDGAGTYTYTWFDPRDGRPLGEGQLVRLGDTRGPIELPAPGFAEDLAVRIQAR